MKRMFLVLGSAVAVLPWLIPAKVQADMIQWTASGSPIGPNLNPSSGTVNIQSQNFGAGAIVLLPGTTQSGTNSASVVALRVDYGVNPDSNEAAIFRGPSDDYSLRITLHDDASGTFGSLIFRGNLSGEYASVPAFWNTYLGSTTQTLKLGQNLYTVTMGSYINGTGINFDGSGTYGTISANISVQPIGPVSPTPEPSTLLLACLALPPLGLARWFRRHRRREAVGSHA